jgi:hypothetical protein
MKPASFDTAAPTQDAGFIGAYGCPAIVAILVNTDRENTDKINPCFFYLCSQTILAYGTNLE